MKNAYQTVCYLFGIGLFAVFLHTFVDPELCKTGCGNVTEPIFRFLYWAFGPWGTRIGLFAAATFFFWFGAAENRD